MVEDAPGRPDPPAYVPNPPPYVDEGYPGIGRRAGILQQERHNSGGLTDDDAGDPVIDKHPFVPKGGR